MFFGVKNSRSGERGYTLIDLAMALTIFGLLLAGVATGARVYMKDKQITQTREYSRIVANAIENYVLEKGHFPCPAKVNAQIQDANYGRATACSTGYNAAIKEVTVPIAAGNFDATLGLWAEQSDDSAAKMVVRGMVPFATLNIPEFYAYDAHGNRLMYAVTASLTDEKGFIHSSGGGITVMDSTMTAGSAGDVRRTNHYVVFSSGPGEEGAYSRYGVQVKPCGAGLDGENCNTSTSGTNANARYVSARYSLAQGAQRFDDVIVSKSSKHMPLWKPADETGRSIRTVEDDKRVVIKSDSAATVAADPINGAAELRMDVVGDAKSEKAMAPKYCLHGDGNKCFESPELLKQAGSKFDCPAGTFLQGTADGGSRCTNLSWACPGHTSKTPKYIRSIGADGIPVCESYNVSVSEPPALVIGSCGTSHGGIFTSAPSSNLCSAGNPTGVTTGATNYTWSCTGAGDPAECMAYRHSSAVNGTCGSANGGNYTAAPTNNLCATGTAGAVTGTGPWVWVCSSQNGGTNQNCSANWRRNGDCGSANGVPVASPPSSNLCAVGSASSVTGSNPYNWSCSGVSGGSSVSCASGAPTTVNSQCGASNGQSFYSQPTTNLCTTGTQSAVTGSGPWSWSCVGTGVPQGTSSSCSALQRIDGVCGPANGVAVYTAPSSGLCSAGTQTAVSSSSTTFTWSCNGINSGMNVSCSAPRRIDAVCGGSNNTCSAGAGPTGYNAGSCGGSSSWTCQGQSGGANASCGIPNAPCAVNGSCGGSANTCGSGTASGYSAGSCGGSQTWSCVGAHGGSTASCSIANAACAVGGSCGGSANTCNSGTPSGYNAGSCGGSQTWSCVGSGGGGTASCSIANAACAVGGSCGGSANTCASGTPSGYNAGSCGGSQTWSCVGSGGGGTASCSIANGACPTNGACGGAVDSCTSGYYNFGNAAECGTRTWVCKGSNGGSDANCSAELGSCGGWGGGGGGCFTGTTEVIMADGSRKPIANLKKGDKVRGHTQTNAVVSNKPYYVRSILYRINDSADAYVTANHPFYTKGGEWKALDAELARKEHPGMEISELKVGDILIHSDGNEVELKSFTPEDHGWLIVYNPSLDGDHTYYANDLLMHNIYDNVEIK